MANPIVPRNAKDPANQFSNIRDSNKQLNRRYRIITREMKSLIRGLDRTLITANRAIYDYELDSQKFNSINLFIQQLLNEQLLDNQQGTFSRSWWLNFNLENAFEDGARDLIQSAKNISTVGNVGVDISRTVNSISMNNILFSSQYQNSLGLVFARVFNNMSGLTESTKSNLSETLTQGMLDGDGINRLTKKIVDRISVSRSRARRIARTEILNAYRQSATQQTDELNERVFDDTPWTMEQLWFSALAATSRPWHVSRHGSTYTTDEVREFYSERGNAINCLCSQSASLVNNKTGDVLQDKLVARLKKQKKEFQKTGKRKPSK